ncbi:hypothetical protein J2X43_003433 [Rhizobium sp. BE258]|nr:hypothetical protein [Rhizobium sp. BE258]
MPQQGKKNGDTILNIRLIAAANLGPANLFLRQLARSGPDLCSSMSSPDFLLSPWQRSAVSELVYECYNEPRSISPRDDSIFLLVRGDRFGTLDSVRLKYVPANADSAAPMSVRAQNIVEAVITASGWTDFKEELPAVFALRPVEREAFGGALKFGKELSGARYNLSLTLGTSSERSVTRQFFDRQNWLPLNDQDGRQKQVDASMEQRGKHSNPKDR